MTELQIQDAVRLILGVDLAGCFWRNNVGSAVTPDGRHVKYGVGNPGGADLIGVYRGRFVAVEIKTPTGRQNPDQVRYQQLVEGKGGIYAVVRSEQDARDLLDRLRRQ